MAEWLFVVGETGPVQMGIVPGHGNSAPLGAAGPHVCQIMAKVQIPVDVKRPDRSRQIGHQHHGPVRGMDIQPGLQRGGEGNPRVKP